MDIDDDEPTDSGGSLPSSSSTVQVFDPASSSSSEIRRPTHKKHESAGLSILIGYYQVISALSEYLFFILFCFVLFCFICFVLFCFILYCFILFYFVFLFLVFFITFGLRIFHFIFMYFIFGIYLCNLLILKRFFTLPVSVGSLLLAMRLTSQGTGSGMGFQCLHDSLGDYK